MPFRSSHSCNQCRNGRKKMFTFCQKRQYSQRSFLCKLQYTTSSLFYQNGKSIICSSPVLKKVCPSLNRITILPQKASSSCHFHESRKLIRLQWSENLYEFLCLCFLFKSSITVVHQIIKNSNTN